ncbi:MAG: MBL fold metallo-hydrolase [Proteobacteria bacterium]|nr:MBL fold metallo-hydrolase [Pseudomonadota bacterium]
MTELDLNYKITKFNENLFLITLPPVATGFENFIGTWLYKGDITFVVDVGSSSTAQALIDALDEVGITYLDYIFLTHIHVDHAGAAAEIADRFAGTPIICHKDGIPHLADPERLWKGTIKTLGNIATAYGPISPVPIDRLVGAQEFKHDSIIPVITPGHAIHHVSYIYKDYLFAGEAGGVYYSLPSGSFCMRPATPPKFFYELSYKSIDDLISRNPSKICYGHLSLEENAVNMLKQHQDQLGLWKKVITGEVEKSVDGDLISRCAEALLRKDPFLSGYFDMDDAVKEREMIFLTNSIKGFIGYIKDKKL